MYEIEMIRKNPVDHSMRGDCYASETLEGKGFPGNSVRATHTGPQVTAKVLPQTVVKSRRNTRIHILRAIHWIRRDPSRYHEVPDYGRREVGRPAFDPPNYPSLHHEILANAASAACIVAAISSGWCAADTKPASNADGAR